MQGKNWFLLFLVAMMIGIPPVCALQYDGILKYDAADSGSVAGTFAMRPSGHAVFFKNTGTITVPGIRLYGCKYGTGDKMIFVEIWDKDLKQLYRDVIPLKDIAVGQVAYTSQGCGSDASWADIALPDHSVTGDFYVAVFTYSPKPDATTQGLRIGYTTPSSTATSHTVMENPNKIDEITIAQSYDPSQIDWTIRTYYKKAPVTTAVTTPASVTPVTTGAVETTVSAIAPPADPTTAVPATTAEPTKAGIGTGLIVIGIGVSLILWKRQ